MPITELPTKTVGSLGPPKVESRAYLNTATELPAVELEAIKQAIIDLYGEVGLTDGSTPDSINANSGSPGPGLGALLWEWDGSTLDGIDSTALDYEGDLGTATPNAATALILDVFALGGIWGNCLRLVATGLDGGGIFRMANTITLPESYVIQARVVHVMGTSTLFESHPIVPMYTDADGSDNLHAVMLERKVGSASLTCEMVVNDIHEHGLGLNGSGIPHQDKIDTGGILITCTIHKRQAGEATARVVLATLDESWGQTTNGPIQDGYIPTDDADVGVHWDSNDLDRCGFGAVDASGGAGVSGTFYIKSIGVYERPAL